MDLTSRKFILIALTLLILVGFSVAAYEYTVIKEREDTIERLDQDLNTTRENLAAEMALTEELSSTLEQSNLTIDVLKDELGLAQSEIEMLTPVERSSYVVGVRNDGSGVVIPLNVKVVKGEGDISVSINNVDIASGTQESVRTAVEVASILSGANASEKDITVSFINSGPEIVTLNGSSAGAVTTVALYAALEDRQLTEGILGTGSILRNGRVGPVGEVQAKAVATEEFGADVFLVPEGTSASVSGLSIIEVGDIEEMIAIMVE